MRIMRIYNASLILVTYTKFFMFHGCLFLLDNEGKAQVKGQYIGDVWFDTLIKPGWFSLK